MFLCWFLDFFLFGFSLGVYFEELQVDLGLVANVKQEHVLEFGFLVLRFELCLG